MTKTALIWGVAGGIGAAIARRLKADGWRILAFTRRWDDPAGVADQTFAADVADPFAVQAAVLQAGQEADEVHLFVHTAGDIVAEPVGRMTPDTFRRILDANLIGVYNALHHSLPLLTADAPVVLIGAVSERMRLPGLSAYAAAKAGLEAFAEALRKAAR